MEEEKTTPPAKGQHKVSRVLSLRKIAAWNYADQLNKGYVKPSNDVLATLAPLADDVLCLILPFLHYRWIKAIMTSKPSVEDRANTFLKMGMKREEDFHRLKGTIDIPLIKVYEEEDTFMTRDFDDHGLMVLDYQSPFELGDEFEMIGEVRQNYTWPSHEPDEKAIVSIEEFKEQFEIFTEGQLKYINWDNVLVAGGAVLASLLPVPENKRKEDKRAFIHDVGYETSDIDIFIYGLDKSQIQKKVEELFEQIVKAVPKRPIKIKQTSHTLTITRGGYPYRPIQIVVSNLQRPSEVLSNFDIDCVCFGYDGKDVMCLPRAREAINTGVNVINSALSIVAYARIMKWQARHWAFAMSDFLTVPLGGTKHVEDVVLAIAKMNLLYYYDVVFDTSDNLLQWDKESAYGCQLEDNPRAIIEPYDTKTPYQANSAMDYDEDEMWQSSCGRVGVFYGKQEIDEDDEEEPSEEEIEKNLKKLKKLLPHIEDSPWTWLGAPEFSDWELHGPHPTETAILKVAPFITKFKLEGVDELKKRSWISTTTEKPKWKKKPKRKKEDNPRATISPDEVLHSVHTEEDEQGFSWTLKFLPVEEDKFDSNDEGVVVSIEIDEECSGVKRAREENAKRPKKEEKKKQENRKKGKRKRIGKEEKEEEGEEWCAVVGAIQFSQNSKHNLLLDFTHRFSEDNRKIRLVAYWSSLHQKEDINSVDVSLDIRVPNLILPVQ